VSKQIIYHRQGTVSILVKIYKAKTETMKEHVYWGPGYGTCSSCSQVFHTRHMNSLFLIRYDNNTIRFILPGATSWARHILHDMYFGRLELHM
jgi:hypothetical protein